MRKQLPLTLFLFLLTAAGVSAGERITVGRIRLDIDGIRFSDDGSGLRRESPDSEGLPGIRPETVLTFTALRAGSSWSEPALERETRRTARRLSESGYFYDTQAIAVPSSEDPAVWNVRISVAGGFRLRFGGGDSYAMFGLAAVDGRRQELRFWGGYNRAGAAWEGRSPGHFYWETSALYTNEGSYDHPPRWHRAELAAGGGWQPVPDFRIGLALLPDWYIPTEKGTEPHTGLRFGPRFGLAADFFPDPFLMETEIRGQSLGVVSLTTDDPMAFQAEGDALARLSWKRLALCGKLSGGWADDNLPGLYLTDLYDTEDRSVRSGWSEGELTAGTWLFLSAELRLTVIEQFIPPFLALGTELFLFTDHAFVPEWRDAWGAGLRIKLDNPMFVFFTFSLGWNREGEPRFVLTTTAGF